MSEVTPLQLRQRGSARLAALLAAALTGLALLGRGTDPASRRLPAADQPGGALTIGAAIALTGNANLYGQDQRLGLTLAQRWFHSAAGSSSGVQPRPATASAPAIAAASAGTSASATAAAPTVLRPVRLRLEDGASDEASAIAAFNLLIQQGVVALVGPTLSQQAFAADPIAQRRGVPVVAPSNTAKGIPQIGSFISRVSAQSSVIAPLSLQEALRRDPSLRRVALFYAQDDAYSTAEIAIFQKALAARGLTPLSVQRTQMGQNDFQNPITAVLPLQPELVVISVQAVDGGNLVRQLRELGYRGQIVVGNGLNTPNIYPICRQHCDGILIAQAYSPELNSPINRAFLQLYRSSGAAGPPPQIAAQAFTAYQVLFEAIQRLQQRGGLSGITLAEGRRRLMAELLRGRYDTPLGPIRFAADGEVIQERFFVAQVQMAADGRHGRFTLVREQALQGASR